MCNNHPLTICRTGQGLNVASQHFPWNSVLFLQWLARHYSILQMVFVGTLTTGRNSVVCRHNSRYDFVFWHTKYIDGLHISNVVAIHCFFASSLSRIAKKDWLGAIQARTCDPADIVVSNVDVRWRWEPKLQALDSGNASKVCVWLRFPGHSCVL